MTKTCSPPTTHSASLGPEPAPSKDFSVFPTPHHADHQSRPIRRYRPRRWIVPYLPLLVALIQLVGVLVTRF